MNRGMIIFIVVGIAVIYLIIGFVGKLKDSNEGLRDDNDKQQMINSKNYRQDIVGQTVLVKTDMPIAKRIGVWKSSPMHSEYLALFPDFSEMALFVDDRIQDRELKKRVLDKLHSIESDYFAGGLTPFQAKESIDKI